MTQPAKNSSAQSACDPSGTEKFLTIKEAAARLGLHYWHLQRAVKRGLIPSYQFLTTKKLVRLSEVIDAIERASAGVSR